MNAQSQAGAFARVFGANLAHARERLGLSQEELGFRAGLHRTAVGQLERGERVARSDTLVRLSCSLNVEPGALLAGLGWRPPRFEAGGLEVQGIDPEAAEQPAQEKGARGHKERTPRNETTRPTGQ